MSAVKRGDTAASSTPLSMAVIGAISNYEGVDPVDLETPLYEVVDLDALDELTAGATDGATVEVTFQYNGYDVHVTSDRDVRIVDPDDR